MATNNSVNVGLSGATGSGNFVGATSPTLVTPTLGAATATSVTFSPTTGGIVGTTTNDSASAGYVGEVISSQILQASAISITNNVAKDLTSISLTAGDWDVYANITFVPSANMSQALCWINTVSATQADSSKIAWIYYTSSIINGCALTAPSQRLSLSGTTTIYVSGLCNFASGTCVISGGIYARRRR